MDSCHQDTSGFFMVPGYEESASESHSDELESVELSSEKPSTER